MKLAILSVIKEEKFMLKQLWSKSSYQVFYDEHQRLLSKLTVMFGLLFFYLYAGEALALQDADRVAEINALTTEVSKLAKNGCYIAGCASALIGAVFSVAQQSLKVFGVAAGVTLLAFKAPTFFSSAILI